MTDTSISVLAADFLSDFEIAGVPASGAARPAKVKGRATFQAVEDRINGLEASQTAGILSRATWAGLDALDDADFIDGATAKVYSDAGTHTDPVVGGTVSNEGVYSFLSGDGWQRIANLESEDVAALVADAEAARTGAEEAAAAAAGAAEGLSGVGDLFVDVTSNNLFDPATGVVGQLTNTNGSVAASPRYGLIKIEGVAGDAFTVSFAGRATQWVLNQAARVMFYNSTTPGTGTLVDSSTAGENDVAFTDSGRTVCGTFPPTAVLAIIMPYASGILTPSADDFADMFAVVMVNEGLAKADFEESVPVGARDFPDDVKNPAPVSYLRVGETIYIRQPHWLEPDRWSVRKAQTYAANAAGTLDFVGQSFVPKLYQRDLSEVAYAAGENVWANVDNLGTAHLNASYITGAHGHPKGFILTSVGHPFTDEKVGQTGVLASQTILLAEVLDADRLWIVPRVAGTDTLWTVPPITVPPTATVAWADDGNVDYTVATGAELSPLVQMLDRRIILDDEIEDEEAVSGGGEHLKIAESYGLPNIAKWQAALIAEKGTSTPRALNSPLNVTQVSFSYHWGFDRYGARTGFLRVLAREEFSLSASGDVTGYFGGQQQQTPFKTGQSTWLHHPGLAAPIGGLDLVAGVVISGAWAGVNVLTSNLADPANPPGFWSQYNTLAGSPTWTLAMGYVHGTIDLSLNGHQVDVPANRKMYGRLFDYLRFPTVGGSGRVVPAGTVISGAFWHQSSRMALHPTMPVNGCFVADDGKVHRAVSINEARSFELLQVPPDLIGKPVTKAKGSTGFILHDTHVGADGILHSNGLKEWAYLIIG